MSVTSAKRPLNLERRCRQRSPPFWPSRRQARSDAQKAELAAHYRSLDAAVGSGSKRPWRSSAEQQKNERLTGVQDLAWALINSPAFLFNR